jgi:hypothetical protein
LAAAAKIFQAAFQFETVRLLTAAVATEESTAKRISERFGTLKLSGFFNSSHGSGKSTSRHHFNTASNKYKSNKCDTPRFIRN